ncbi:MAG: nucleotide exchange factor GrpE [Nanoarchaeota archaeon]|jgi:molecular chaperone GrpE|nr:nucleotide exchange factor GrpE [Nanoarchaeota archaeon]
MEENKTEMTEAGYIVKIQKMQAELENSRKRMEKDKSDLIDTANAKLITNVLPVLDHFELALKYNKDKGVEMIYNELFKVLENQGVEVINTDCVYDANVHEVIAQVEGGEEGEIMEVVQKGFLLNKRLLRASKVKISKVMKK